MIVSFIHVGSWSSMLSVLCFPLGASGLAIMGPWSLVCLLLPLPNSLVYSSSLYPQIFTSTLHVPPCHCLYLLTSRRLTVIVQLRYPPLHPKAIPGPVEERLAILWQSQFIACTSEGGMNKEGCSKDMERLNCLHNKDLGETGQRRQNDSPWTVSGGEGQEGVVEMVYKL